MKPHQVLQNQRYRNRKQRKRPYTPFIAVGGVATSLISPIFIGIMLFVLLVAGGFFAAASAYAYFSKDLVPPEAMADRQISRSTRILDRNGTLLYEIFDPKGGKRTTVPLSEMSPWLIKATIATEDSDFYNNPGINFRGLVRAGLGVLTGEESGGGGSSITQQLAKNVLIPEQERSERSIARKIKEIIYAYELTRRYSKDQILEWYLNEIYYGNLSYGVEAAAQSYFGISARQLDLAQAALIAGMGQAPSAYSPFEEPELAKARQSTVLDLMVRHGSLSESEAENAKREELKFAKQTPAFEAPHFVNYVRDLLEKKYGADAVYRGGLRVTTSLDLGLQDVAQQIVHDQVTKLAGVNAHDGALVAIKPTTGEIVAMVGSVDYWNEKVSGQINMATSPRQPGSSFKPFTYVTAFAKGYTPSTMLLDVPMSFPDGINPPYKPVNVDRKFEGPVSVRHALATSRNVPAVEALAFAGIPDVLATAHKMGITTLTERNRYGLSLTLGGGEVKLLDLVYAYSVFANNGSMAGVPVPEKDQKPEMRKLDPVAILKVEDGDGRVLYDFKAPLVQPVISPQLTYLITNILSDNQERATFFGVDNPLHMKNRPAASKTGTTEDWRDNWTVGYTPDLVAGVWVGNADNSQMYESYGSTAAAPIWNQFMEKALEGEPALPFKVPSGIVKATVCSESGLKPTSACPSTRTDVFIEGTVPTKPCDIHRVYKIDKTTGKLATDSTPKENIVEKTYTILPPEANDWMKQQNIPLPPTEYSTYVTPDVSITSPPGGSFVKGNISISGSAKSDNFASFTLEYGAGTSPTQWQALVTNRQTPVANSILGVLETTRLNGPYTFRLTVVDKDGTRKQAVSSITVDNVPPSIKVGSPANGASFTIKPNTKSVAIQAEANDEFGIARVDFLVDGKSIGTVSAAPFMIQWTMTPGKHTLQAVAYDKAGNQNKSGTSTVTVN